MSILKNWLGGKKIPNFDFSVLQKDMHSHLIPGIDDGSPDMETTINILQKFKELGYSKIITTPHIKTGMFDNTSDVIRKGAVDVQNAISENNLDIEFEAAAEYFFDFSFLEKIEENDILSFSDGHVLLEYSFHQAPMGENEMYFKLQMNKYKPILAHFERYPYYHGSVAKAEELRDKGIKIQLNLLSLFGHYGPQVQKQAALLIKEKQVDLLGSDCHRLQHLEILESNQNNKLLNQTLDLELFNKEL
jgi:tyrosine-protein phosphatase YwqE